MLTELLRVLSTGGLHAMSDVARRLGVSEALVAEMSESLASRGYLAALNSCGPGCDGCGLASLCGPEQHTRQRTLMLTEKGRRAAMTG